MPGKKSDFIKEADEQVKAILQENIKKVRKQRKVTQLALSEALGISRETYSNYEVRTLPPQYLLFKLAQIYNVTPDVFYRENLDAERLFAENDNSDIYGESSFCDLTDYEKILIMKIRQLNRKDKDDVSDFVKEKLDAKNVALKPE